MNPLGKGLGSLIPQKETPPEDSHPLDVLHHQVNLDEPVYRFHDEGKGEDREKRIEGEPAPIATVASAPASFAPRPRRSESVFWIEIAKIQPNPYQPRKTFGVDELTALATSIQEHGILQPLVVTKKEIETGAGLDVMYELIAGERRLRAAKLAGLREVPVMIRTAATAERDKLELALIENVQREDLNPLERARAFDQLIAEFGLMQKEVATRIGKSREVVANSLRLLKLPEEIQVALASNNISESHARILLSLDGNLDAQMRVFGQIQTANLTVRDAELAARGATGADTGTRRRGAAARLSPDLRDVQRRLEEAFGTRVKLMKKGEQGRIVVEFYSEEELNGILSRITKKEEGYI
jgi:ParB family chromosome partitioning protein